MKEEANKLAGKTKEEAPVLSTEDQEIKQLEDRRKELRKKGDRSQREKIEYAELNKAVKKKRRHRSRKKRTDRVETILQSGRGPKHIYEGGPKKRKCEMKNEEKKKKKNKNKTTKNKNKANPDRNEILKICTRFYTEPYSSTPQDKHPH